MTIIHARDVKSEIKNKNKKRVIRMFENPLVLDCRYLFDIIYGMPNEWKAFETLEYFLTFLLANC